MDKDLNRELDILYDRYHDAPGSWQNSREGRKVRLWLDNVSGLAEVLDDIVTDPSNG